MNVIDSYLDTLFAPYPTTPSLVAARSELRAMMEDKVTALMAEGHTESQALGQVIAEFGSLEELAPVLGIERDLGGPDDVRTVDRQSSRPRLTLSRAKEFAAAVKANQPLISWAVPLFVLSPITLLALIFFTGPDEPAGWGIAVGIVVVLVIVLAGVLLLVMHSSKMEEYKDIENGELSVTPDVVNFAQDLRREHRQSAVVGLSVAIALWVLSAIPVLLTALLPQGDTDLPLLGVCGTLIMVALGLFIMLRTTWVDGVFETLLAESSKPDVSSPENSQSPAVRVLAALYWPLVVAIFLGWSFGFSAWHISWLIWPIAGVLYGALWAANASLQDERYKSRR